MTSRASTLKRIGGIGALLVSGLGLCVLIGWYADIAVLRSVMPDFTPMRPHTAASLILLGIAVWRLHSRLATVLAALAGLLAIEALVATTVGAPVLPVDLLLPGIDAGEWSPRMAPATALGLLLLAVAVVLAPTQNRDWGRGLATATFAIGYVAVLGYSYDVNDLYTVGGYTSVALHTALALCVLSVALLMQTPDEGLVGLARESGGAGRLLRTLVPFLLVIPAVLGELRLLAQNAGWFGTPFGSAILVMGMTGLGLAVTWLAALQIRAIDLERAGSARALVDLNRTLEREVDERTAELGAVATRLATLIRLAPVGIAELDNDGAVVTSNDTFAALSGLTADESRGMGWVSALHPDDAERAFSEWAQTAAAGRSFSTTLRLVLPSGHVHWVQGLTNPLVEHGELTGHLAVAVNVTELRQAQIEAAESSARFHAIFESSPVGTALASSGGRIVEANRRLCELTGMSAEELRTRRVADLFRIEDVTDDTQWLAPLLSGEMETHHMERRLARPGPEPAWVRVSVALVTEAEQPLGLLFKFEDVTARRRAEEWIEHLATHDALTNLPNRLLLLDRLRQALHHARRYGGGVGVLFIDLDRFKFVNDTFGHDVGDALLAKVAVRLQRCARATDTVARLGGDEFVVVCPDVANDQDVLTVAAHVREAMGRPISVGQQELSVDVSIGVALGAGTDSAEQLLKDADHAMYQAKSRGRDRFEVFSEGLRGRIQSRLDTELALRGAAERDEIETWFQPIVDLQENGAVVAREALVRWRRPHHGLVMPLDFIRVAEESGEIKALGTAVLTQSCLAALDADEGWSVSVNVSAKQFINDDFGAIVDSTLEATGLPPSRLWLELTESSVVGAIDSAAATFQRLRRRGVKVAIDDFGVGYSSFAHLRQFPVDLLKVDMTFVRDIVSSQHDRAILHGMLRMAEALALDLVAEGIETTQQRDLLRELGCHLGQGFLFGRPAPLNTPPVLPRQATREPTPTVNRDDATGGSPVR
ncbi:MAG: putative bifunctional diguanylate cyclase/phosphodiesterase [Nocardioides sp.]